MIRNLILLCVLILFWFGLHAQYHWIPVFKEKNVYMSDIHPEKNKKITDMETYHETVSSEKIFTEMIANNKQGIILALKDNNKKFWVDQEGYLSKFQRFIIQKILDVNRNNRNIDYKGSKTPDEAAYEVDSEVRYYEVSLRCEYEELIVLINEIEKSNRIYKVDKLVIKNSPDKQKAGLDVTLKLKEITIDT